MIFLSGSDWTILTAFADVQQMSVSAFTSAVVLTYDTTGAPGCSALSSLRDSTSTMAAIGHLAFGFGCRTVLSGFSILADSAMKSTPQNTMTLASVFEACTESPYESPRKSDTSWTSFLW